ncbi:hypothetical protein K1T71_001196 [Dendrolimus kikuchii]|uniref:Uncharacterized protein n=1 Tax=Dendrolimus kikuchii TaxID=765133 RepID=A0ACC1DHD4_9NEOP|nr:hypothetical protein K1T71_001196 [Dendrolimus kikuchii]
MWHCLLLLATLNCVISVDMPKYMRACSRTDRHLNACALKSARAAIRQFSLGDPSKGLPPLDPLYVAQMTAFVPNQQGFKIVFKGNNFTGLSEMFLEDLSFLLDCVVDYISLLIIINSNLLIIILEIGINDTLFIYGRFLYITIYSLWIKIGDDGQIYWKIYDQDVTYEVEKATFRLENLLYDKSLGEQINRLINKMSQEIVNDVGPYICKSLSTAVADNIGIFLAQVPYDILMPQ